MPYDKFKRGGKICIYKVDGNKKPVGGSLGCHDSDSKANRQLAALYASEEKQMADEKTENVEKNIHEDIDIEWFPGTSFDELEEYEKLEEQSEKVMKGAKLVPVMASNVMFREESSNKENALKKIGQGFSDWISKVFGRDDNEMKERPENAFLVVKDLDGRYLWFARYSNNIKDRDKPPDIISSKSHMRFVEKVDNGEFEMPDLWLWHEPSLLLGKATWVDYDQENGIAMAAGVFYPWAQHIAKAIQESDVLWSTSHGMPTSSIVRDEENPHVIVEHQTVEISPVPFVKAANIWADFVPFLEKEIQNMALNDQKRDELKDFLPITDEDLAKIEERNKAISKTADNLSIERKDTEKEVDTDEHILDEKEVESEEETTEEVDEKEIEETEEIPSAFTADQRTELKDLFGAVTKELLDILDERYAAKQVEDDEELEPETKTKAFDLLTAAGLQEEVVGNLKSLSATVAEETKIDGRTKEGKAMPEETEFDQTPIVDTGIPVLNEVLSGLINAEPVGKEA